MKKRDVWEIYRRWQAGQSLSHIAVSERRDRKSVRYYLEEFGSLGLAPSGTSMDDQQFYQVVQNLLPTRNERPAPGSEQLLPHVDELRELINRGQEALKPKTAYLVVRRIAVDAFSPTGWCLGYPPSPRTDRPIACQTTISRRRTRGARLSGGGYL
jgi:hypothetical protein